MAKELESQHKINKKGILSPLQTKRNLEQHSEILFFFTTRHGFTVSRVFENETFSPAEKCGTQNLEH